MLYAAYVFFIAQQQFKSLCRLQQGLIGIDNEKDMFYAAGVIHISTTLTT